jgi:ferredoxin
MAQRKIVKIDESRCDGCGLCVNACTEAAIEIVGGKARLAGEVFCDGLGACLDVCPHDAISIEEREADAFDARAVERRKHALHPQASGCPSAAVRDLRPRAERACPSAAVREAAAAAGGALANWPIQLALIPPHAPFLREADLVLAADCTAFARPSVLSELAAGRPVLIACPKLDDSAAYVEKVADILAEARPRSVTIIHMTVPCCHGLNHVVRQAMEHAGEAPPVSEVTVGIDGRTEAVSHWPARPALAGRRP